MKAAWIALAMIVAGASWAESPKSSGTAKGCPTVEVNCSNQAQESAYPTKDAPLPITILQPTDEAQRAAKRERNTDEYQNADIDAKVRLADDSRRSVWISGVGTAIALGALIFLVKTFRETKNAADAARDQVELSREEFRATHRPRIILRESYTLPETGGPVTVTYVFENTGGTKATIIGSAFGCRYSLTDEVKRQIEIGAEKEGDIVQNIIPSGTDIIAGAQCKAAHSFSVEWPKGVALFGATYSANAQLTAISPNGWDYFFFGRVSYEDTSGIVRNMAFYRKLELRSYRFIPFGDPQLEYADERA